MRRGARYLLAHTVCKDARSRVSLEISGRVAAGAFVCWLTLTPPLPGRYTLPQTDPEGGGSGAARTRSR